MSRETHRTARVEEVSNDDPSLDFANPRVAAGVLFTDAKDRVLMVVPSYKDYLDIPGGYVENGETPYQAAKREVHEELGIRPPIGRLLVADWWPDSPEAGGGAKLLLVFDGGLMEPSLKQAITVDGKEIVATEFQTLGQVNQSTIPRLANRIEFALRAGRADDLTYYLERGLNLDARNGVEV